MEGGLYVYMQYETEAIKKMPCNITITYTLNLYTFDITGEPSCMKIVEILASCRCMHTLTVS